MKTKLILILCVFGLFGCSKKLDHKKLQTMLQSNDVLQIIRATDYISKHKETDMIKNMLEEPFDPRISYDASHYGMSVYQAKMLAMKKITGLASPKEITQDVDSSNVKFYKEEAIRRGWIK